MTDYTPKYIIIQNYIIDRINQGTLEIGDKLPSENELSEIFNVSRVTSNKAIAELSIIGIVERVKGKGTFVKATDARIQNMSHIISKSFKISSEANDMKAHKVEKIEIVKADEITVQKLHLNDGENVCKIIRIMDNNLEPIAIDYSYIPAYMFKGDFPDKNNFPNCYIHEYMKHYLHQKPKHMHIHIDAKLPDDFEMKILNAPKDKPLIIWDTNIIDKNNRIIAYTTTIAKSEKYRPFINFELQ